VGKRDPGPLDAHRPGERTLGAAGPRAASVDGLERQPELGGRVGHGKPDGDARLADPVGGYAPQRRPRLDQLDSRRRSGDRHDDARGIAGPGVAHAHDGLERLAVGGLTVAVALATAVAVVPRHVDDLQARRKQLCGRNRKGGGMPVVAALLGRLHAQMQHAGCEVETTGDGQGQLSSRLGSERTQRLYGGRSDTGHVGDRPQRDAAGQPGAAVGETNVDERLLAGVEAPVGKQRSAVVELDLRLQPGGEYARLARLGDRSREGR